MINNNHKKEGCGFAEELVSYLYDETGAADGAAFEAHLGKCAACADELEAFSGARFSIGDWKAKEFDTIVTPVFEIPYEKTVQTEITNVGWLAGLRGLLSLTPGWSLATASLAILAVCVGIVLFALNSRKDNQIAENDNNKKIVTTPTAVKSPEQANVIKNEDNAPEKEVNPVNEQEKPQPTLAVKPVQKKQNATKTTNNTRETNKVAEKDAPKTNDVKRNNKNNNDIPPSILGDEDEDDTLRLAELFEEIDTDE